MGGKGVEIIKKIKIPDYPLLILLPEFQSNTYDAYQCYKQSNIPVSPAQKINYSPPELKNFSVPNNDLYSAVLKIHPTLKHHLQTLENTHPLATQMSGSGSSLFAIYENTAIRNNAYNSLQNSKTEKREQKNPSSKKLEQPFSLYKTQILPTFNFFNKNQS